MQCWGRKWEKPGCRAGLAQLPLLSCSGRAQVKGDSKLANFIDNKMEKLFWVLGPQTPQRTGHALGTEGFICLSRSCSVP